MHIEMNTVQWYHVTTNKFNELPTLYDINTGGEIFENVVQIIHTLLKIETYITKNP